MNQTAANEQVDVSRRDPQLEEPATLLYATGGLSEHGSHMPPPPELQHTPQPPSQPPPPPTPPPPLDWKPENEISETQLFVTSSRRHSNELLSPPQGVPPVPPPPSGPPPKIQPPPPSNPPPESNIGEGHRPSTYGRNSVLQSVNIKGSTFSTVGTPQEDTIQSRDEPAGALRSEQKQALSGKEGLTSPQGDDSLQIGQPPPPSLGLDLLAPKSTHVPAPVPSHIPTPPPPSNTPVPPPSSTLVPPPPPSDTPNPPPPPSDTPTPPPPPSDTPTPPPPPSDTPTPPPPPSDTPTPPPPPHGTPVPPQPPSNTPVPPPPINTPTPPPPPINTPVRPPSPNTTPDASLRMERKFSAGSNTSSEYEQPYDSKGRPFSTNSTSSTSVQRDSSNSESNLEKSVEKQDAKENTMESLRNRVVSLRKIRNNLKRESHARQKAEQPTPLHQKEHASSQEQSNSEMDRTLAERSSNEPELDANLSNENTAPGVDSNTVFQPPLIQPTSHPPPPPDTMPLPLPPQEPRTGVERAMHSMDDHSSGSVPHSLQHAESQNEEFASSRSRGSSTPVEDGSEISSREEGALPNPYDHQSRQERHSSYSSTGRSRRESHQSVSSQATSRSARSASHHSVSSQATSRSARSASHHSVSSQATSRSARSASQSSARGSNYLQIDPSEEHHSTQNGADRKDHYHSPAESLTGKARRSGDPDPLSVQPGKHQKDGTRSEEELSGPSDNEQCNLVASGKELTFTRKEYTALVVPDTPMEKEEGVVDPSPPLVPPAEDSHWVEPKPMSPRKVEENISNFMHPPNHPPPQSGEDGSTEKLFVSTHQHSRGGGSVYSTIFDINSSALGIVVTSGRDEPSRNLNAAEGSQRSSTLSKGGQNVQSNRRASISSFTTFVDQPDRKSATAAALSPDLDKGAHHPVGSRPPIGLLTKQRAHEYLKRLYSNLSSGKRTLYSAPVKSIADVIHVVDENKDGFITHDDLQDALKRLDMPLRKADVKQLVDMLYRATGCVQELKKHAGFQVIDCGIALRGVAQLNSQVEGEERPEKGKPARTISPDNGLVSPTTGSRTSVGAKRSLIGRTSRTESATSKKTVSNKSNTFSMARQSDVNRRNRLGSQITVLDSSSSRTKPSLDKLACWVSSLGVWKRNGNRKRLCEDFRTGVLLCKIVQVLKRRQDPNFAFVGVNMRAHSRASIMKNFELALSMVWKSRVQARHMPSTGTLVDKLSPKVIRSLLSEVFHGMAMPHRSQQIELAKWVQAVLGSYSARWPSWEHLQARDLIDDPWLHFGSGVQLVSILHFFCGDRGIADAGLPAVNLLKVFVSPANELQLKSNAALLFTLLQEAGVEVPWEAADFVEGSATDFLILQIWCMYERFRHMEAAAFSPSDVGRQAFLTPAMRGPDPAAGILVPRDAGSSSTGEHNDTQNGGAGASHAQHPVPLPSHVQHLWPTTVSEGGEKADTDSESEASTGGRRKGPRQASISAPLDRNEAFQDDVESYYSHVPLSSSRHARPRRAASSKSPRRPRKPPPPPPLPKGAANLPPGALWMHETRQAMVGNQVAPTPKTQSRQVELLPESARSSKTQSRQVELLPESARSSPRREDLRSGSVLSDSPLQAPRPGLKESDGLQSPRELSIQKTRFDPSSLSRDDLERLQVAMDWLSRARVLILRDRNSAHRMKFQVVMERSRGNTREGGDEEPVLRWVPAGRLKTIRDDTGGFVRLSDINSVRYPVEPMRLSIQIELKALVPRAVQNSGGRSVLEVQAATENESLRYFVNLSNALESLVSE